MLGIFPTTYVEIIPQDAVASQVLLRMLLVSCLKNVLVISVDQNISGFMSENVCQTLVVNR